MHIRIAESMEDIREVWKLTHDAYVSKGYAHPQTDGMLKHYKAIDEISQTTVFMMEDDDGTLVGTNSLTVDGPGGLHVDVDFKNIVDKIRTQCMLEGKSLGASWRIVTAKNIRNRMSVILGLIGATIEVGRQIPLDVTLFTFNPKHEKIYRKLLGLKTISEPRNSASVKNAPAILMRGDMDILLKVWNDIKKRRPSARIEIKWMEAKV